MSVHPLTSKQLCVPAVHSLICDAVLALCVYHPIKCCCVSGFVTDFDSSSVSLPCVMQNTIIHSDVLLTSCSNPLYSVVHLNHWHNWFLLNGMTFMFFNVRPVYNCHFFRTANQIGDLVPLDNCWNTSFT